MASTFYSSFFSSGLLSQHSPRPLTPRPASPTTPRPSTVSLAPEDTTPTAPAPAAAHDVFSATEDQVLPSISVAAPSNEQDSRPRLRRRRSSLAGAASPLANMKSSAPMRQVAASVQRQNLTLRSRAGSDASILSTATASSVSSFSAMGLDNVSAPAVQRPSGFLGRLRSGSLGTALMRPRRALRRAAAPPMPAPPPNAPLPALPPLPVSSNPSRTLPTIIASPTQPTTPRRPLTHRSQTCDNYDIAASPFSVAGASPMYVHDDEDSFAAACGGLPSSPGWATGRENGMEVDYPSPIDGASFDWAKRN
ncbi:hypothetical protein BC628DRAFT_1328993 [Trametes gibbosa]|nr:hypothetical protein BC628DRAFT_1328993 [Trametes gibbosa]